MTEQIIEQIYIGTYREDDREPVKYWVTRKELEDNSIPGETERDAINRLLCLLKQCKRRGFWMFDG